MPISTQRRHVLTFGALAVATVLAVTACAGGATDEPATDGSGGILIVGTSMTEIPSLDTMMSSSAGGESSRFVGNAIYESLTRFDLTQSETAPDLEGALATDWESNDDATEWTFHLREGVVFHDGEPFDADAVIWNLDRWTDATGPFFNASINVTQFKAQVASYEKVDDMTVKFTLTSSISWYPENVTAMFFTSPAYVEANGSAALIDAPIGTGPYKVVSVDHSSELVMEPNAEWWDDPAKLDQLIIKPIPDATTRVAALQSGEVNWIEAPNPDSIESLESSGFSVVTAAYSHLWPWFFDLNQEPFDDIRVRQALNYAIDRESIVENLLSNTAYPAYQLTPRGEASYDPANDVYSYDPEKAKELLEEAGYPDGFSTRLLYPTSGSGNMIPGPMNEALQAQLAEIGVEVELEPIEWATLVAPYLKGEVPGGAPILNVSASFQTKQIWNTYLNSTSPVNVSHYDSPEVDALLAEATTTVDVDARTEIFAEIGAIVTEDAPWLFVVGDEQPRVMTTDVQGFIPAKSWSIDLTTIWVG